MYNNLSGKETVLLLALWIQQLYSIVYIWKESKTRQYKRAKLRQDSPIVKKKQLQIRPSIDKLQNLKFQTQ